MEQVKKAFETVQENMNKSVDEYLTMSVKAQDEMFALATNQMKQMREYTEFALKAQADLLSQLEKTARQNRELYMDGLKQYRESVNAGVAKVSETVAKAAEVAKK